MQAVEKLEGDAENLHQLKSNTYDRYVSAGSIEYWPHPHKGIEEAYRVVKPGVSVVVAVGVRAFKLELLSGYM